MEESVSVLKRVGRPNFGIIYEPANLDLCGQDYGPETIRRFAPWLFNVYLQNHRLNPAGSMTLNTWVRGPAPHDPVPLQETGGIDFPVIMKTLRELGYDGYVTVHQAFAELMEPGRRRTPELRLPDVYRGFWVRDLRPKPTRQSPRPF